MSHEDEQCLRLGRMVFGMITDVQATPATDVCVAQREVTFPGGKVSIFIVRGDELAALMRKTAEGSFDVVDMPVGPSGVQ
jgi:hypothetical protein